jgi:hypothetical protein
MGRDSLIRVAAAGGIGYVSRESLRCNRPENGNKYGSYTPLQG